MPLAPGFMMSAVKLASVLTEVVSARLQFVEFSLDLFVLWLRLDEVFLVFIWVPWCLVCLATSARTFCWLNTMNRLATFLLCNSLLEPLFAFFFSGFEEHDANAFFFEFLCELLSEFFASGSLFSKTSKCKTCLTSLSRFCCCSCSAAAVISSRSLLRLNDESRQLLFEFVFDFFSLICFLRFCLEAVCFQFLWACFCSLWASAF